jgi:hypothetical protein
LSNKNEISHEKKNNKKDKNKKNTLKSNSFKEESWSQEEVIQLIEFPDKSNRINKLRSQIT